MNSLKIAMLLKSYYPDQDDDFIASAAHELSQRKALTINPDTGEIVVFDAIAVREIGVTKLLSPLPGSKLAPPKLQAIDPDMDPGTKAEIAARNMMAIGLNPDLMRNVDVDRHFDAKAIADFAKANPIVGGQ